MTNLIIKLQKVTSRIRNTGRIGFVTIITLTSFFIAFILSIVFSYLRDWDIIILNFPDREKNLITLFFTTVIITPIMETFLNQYLPYYLLKKVKYFQERSYLILLASALFFGLLHLYSLFYIIFGFLLGLVFMYGYMVRIKTDNKTFYLIAITHALFNLGVFIIKLLQT